MDAETLLQLTPELLAKAIVHRHERLVEELPEQISQRQEELDFAEPLAKQARSKRDDINSMVAKLKSERDSCTAKARQCREEANSQREKLQAEGKLRNPDPKWARAKLDEKILGLENELQTQAGDHKREQKVLREMRDLQAEHDDWVSANIAKVPELKAYHAVQQEMRRLYDQAQKAHTTMLELVEENEQFHTYFIEHEDSRRRAASRLGRSNRTLDTSRSAIDRWNERLSNGFDELLKDAERVKTGGMSTIAIRREEKRKQERLAEKSASEEE